MRRTHFVLWHYKTACAQLLDRKSVIGVNGKRAVTGYYPALFLLRARMSFSLIAYMNMQSSTLLVVLLSSSQGNGAEAPPLDGVVKLGSRCPKPTAEGPVGRLSKHVKYAVLCKLCGMLLTYRPLSRFQVSQTSAFF